MRRLKKCIVLMLAGIFMLQNVLQAAAQEISSVDAFQHALESGNNVYLINDLLIPATTSINLAADADIELNLNGHTITFEERNDAFISVPATTTLTITDSSGDGKITGSNQNIFHVFGTLNLDDGELCDNTASTVNVNVGGTFHMTGGIIHRNNVSGNGAAIYSDGGTVTISENALIEKNTSVGNGGAIYVENSELTISGGIIKDNETTSGSGGGICANHSTVTMSGGTVGGINESELETGILTDSQINEGNRAYRYAGGIFLQNNTNFTMTGGKVEGNQAQINEGGGITLTGSNGTITRGEIANNRTYTDQHWGGGGIFCADGATLYIENLLVTNNTAGGFGGGLAGCSTGRTFLFADHGGAVFNNEAYGEHVSGTQSSKNADHTYAKNSPVFMENGYEDFFSAYINMAFNTMLGGGYANWAGSVDGAPINLANAADKNTAITSSYIMGLTAYPTEEAIEDAWDAKTVYIHDNYSYTHGGGILCDGYMVVGKTSELELSKSLEIKAAKSLIDEEGNKLFEQENGYNGTFTFEVKDGIESNAQTVSTGTTDENGDIVFQPMLKFSSENCKGDGPWVFTYYISENNTNANVLADSTIYKLSLTASKLISEQLVGNERITTTKYQLAPIKVGDVKKSVNGGASWEDVNFDFVSRGENHWNTLTLYSDDNNGDTFTNYIYKERLLKISKKTEGEKAGGNKEFAFTLSLKDRNDKTYIGTLLLKNGMTLSAENDVYKFTLKDSEFIEILIPYGFTYEIAEEDYSTEDYVTSITIDGVTEEINRFTSVMETDQSIDFVNTLVKDETAAPTGDSANIVPSSVTILLTVVMILEIMKYRKVYH